MAPSMKFKLLNQRPFGVPIYLETADFNQVSIRLIVFTGGADDVVGGGPGIYHWFEHIPFRGTKLFPNGYEDTMGRLERYGGATNANTSFNRTMFLSTVPKGHWREAFRLITDLASQPLLTIEGIEAERKVIHSEIAGRVCSIAGYAWHTLFQDHLWRGHPYGHNITGTEDELNKITPEMLHEARRRGYDRSRMVLVVSGPVTAEELCKEAEALWSVLPDHGLSERRFPAEYGPVPAWEPGEITFPTSFDSSLVITAWPIPAVTAADVQTRTHLWVKLIDLFNAGSLASPIMQITRGDKQLVYGAGAGALLYPETGMFYLSATTRQDPKLVLDAFHQALIDDRVRSKARYQYVNDHVTGSMEMTVLNPHTHTKLLAATLLDGEAICTHDEILARDLAIGHDELLAALATFTPETAKTFIFKAKQK